MRFRRRVSGRRAPRAPRRSHSSPGRSQDALSSSPMRLASSWPWPAARSASCSATSACRRSCWSRPPPPPAPGPTSASPASRPSPRPRPHPLRPHQLAPVRLDGAAVDGGRGRRRAGSGAIPDTALLLVIGATLLYLGIDLLRRKPHPVGARASSRPAGGRRLRRADRPARWPRVRAGLLPQPAGLPPEELEQLRSARGQRRPSYARVGDQLACPLLRELHLWVALVDVCAHLGGEIVVVARLQRLAAVAVEDSHSVTVYPFTRRFTSST